MASHLTIADDQAAGLVGLQGLSEADGPIIGIDLGTSNTAVCAFIKGKPTILDLRLWNDGPPGESTSLPSVLCYRQPTKAEVGYAALPGLCDLPRQTIHGAKRFVGRRYDSIHVQRMLDHFPYKVTAGREGQVAVDIGGKTVSLVNIQGRILKAARDAAEYSLKTSVQRAVVTVPAYYDNNQRSAVIRAGRLAGLTVERIISEPTAAAIAYGINTKKPQTILVYDLGGGTFDVSIMRVSAGEIQVKAISGDTFLGGNDFDDTLVGYVRHALSEQDCQLANDHETIAALHTAAERAKKSLTLHDQTTVLLHKVRTVKGESIRVEVPITRQQFEHRTAHLVEKTLKGCTFALNEAKMKTSDIDHVLLVGGQTRAPQVKRMVGEFFDQQPRSDLSPDDAVALGAGIFANLPTDSCKRFTDVLPMSIGLGIQGAFKVLLRRNTALPCQQIIKFTVPRSDFQTYRLAIWQGDQSALHRNEQLAEVAVTDLAFGPIDPAPLTAEFIVGDDGMLRVIIGNRATQERRQVLINTVDAP